MTGCKANSMLSQSTFPQGEDGLDDFLFTEKNSLASYGYNIQNSQNMDKQKIHYCFTLSDAQMEYLRCKKYKIDRMECFMSLASLAERETTLVSISKTQQVEILCGQCLVDNTQLAKLWDKDRKTVPKLLQAMEAVGISSSQKVGDNRIITMHSLSGWYVDGRFVKNGFSLKRNADGSAIVHTEVPQARVIVTTTEDDTKSDKEDGHFSNGISDTDNKGNSSTADISSSLNSASSNDNGSVGKIGTNSNLSDAITGGFSPQQNYSRQSVGNPSSLQEADAKQNDGEHNTYPQHQFGGQTQQSNGFNANGYNNNYNSQSNYQMPPKQMDLSPLSTGEWLLTLIVGIIPCAGLILYIIWAFGNSGNLNRRNYCRASLILQVISYVLVVFFILIVVVGGGISYYGY